MSRQVQLRRGTATEHESFTGAVGETTYDTTEGRLRAHDGATAGGIRLARLDEIALLNRLHNGDMAIDQWNAGAAYTLTTSYSKCAVDRWQAVMASGGAWTAQQVATGDDDFPNALRLKRTQGSSATAAGYLTQEIESKDCQNLAGLDVMLSFYALAGADFSPTNLGVQVLTGTGSDEGVSSLFAATWTGYEATLDTSCNPTGTRTRFNFPLTLPTGMKELAVRFTCTPVGTAGAADQIDITGVGLVPGKVLTPFIRRPYAAELAICKRYAQLVDLCCTDFAPGTGWDAEQRTMFSVEMRNTPTGSGGTTAHHNNSNPSYEAMDARHGRANGTSATSGVYSTRFLDVLLSSEF